MVHLRITEKKPPEKGSRNTVWWEKNLRKKRFRKKVSEKWCPGKKIPGKMVPRIKVPEKMVPRKLFLRIKFPWKKNSHEKWSPEIFWTNLIEIIWLYKLLMLFKATSVYHTEIKKNERNVMNLEFVRLKNRDSDETILFINVDYFFWLNKLIFSRYIAKL